MVLSVGKGKGGPTSHTDVRIHPLGGLKRVSECTSLEEDSTNRAAVYHAACDSSPRRKLEALSLQGSIHLANVG